MNFDIPQAARCWPPKASVIWFQRIGTKCTVAWLPDEEGEWLEAGGVIPPKDGNLETSEGASEGGVSVDTAQARIYFRREGKDQIPVCRVLLPDDAHFRNSRKGRRKGISKSFDDDGHPVPEVLLLYALKTRSHDDRLRAVEAFPIEIWCCDTFGEIFRAMDEAARHDHNFETFAGEQLVRAAAQKDGLSDWALWEKVAEDAAAKKREMLQRANLKEDSLNRTLFLRAVQETAIKFSGLPAQHHVRKRWEALGGIGEWREIRKTFGFEWLPALSDWEKSWPESGQLSGGGHHS